ncbi:MAG: peptide MFS transporter [Alphaproteobacteria bacterium]|nr:peptide MFS transporter [Alphaproteobacteria bacterium]MBV9372986.1 peptide MFS transporter [Alphaproteobacteria bacterium]MBV9901353.1 peptide MFS transporter [Alphaproteobacteria bacterium]
MTVADATPEFDTSHPSDRAFLGHPKGLGYLGFTEACERFSYYSMQTLLVLYMVKQLLLPGHVENIVGFEWLRSHVYGGLQGQPLASAVFGTYTSLVYGTPILGGLLADRLLGRRRTMIVGGVLMSLGHFLMAFEQSFLLALLCLVLGVGCFKGNIASQVGGLYGPSDVRRAMAFQIFYIFINVSVIVAPLVAGTLGEKVGWHWGFGTAGVVMVLGLALYLSGRRWLPADEVRARAPGAARPKIDRADYPAVAALILLIPVLAVALLTNQEIFNAYLVWGDAQFNKTFLGFEAPTSWLITVDATLSFAMLVAVAAFWNFRGKRHWEPDELGKMIIGSVFTVAGGLCLFAAAFFQAPGEKISLAWPLLFHLLNSIGFAHILPISLALFSKIAPKAINATVIGLYYLAFFAANAIVGKVGGLYSSLPTTTFWLIHVASAALGLVAFALFKLVLGKRLETAPASDPLT